MIPVSVLVCVKNEERRLAACLAALKEFDDVIVVDSHSTDRTIDIARSCSVRIAQFLWNGRYPKKYQWSLDHVETKYQRILFVDADEIVTPDLAREILMLDWTCDGYFIKGQPVWKARALRHGLWNNKLALLDKTKFRFPVVDDLDIPGGNELEGHYQPVAANQARIGQLRAAMLHDCADGWEGRHHHYAQWEAGMMAKGAFPADPVPRREAIKKIFRAMPFRGPAVFMYGYGLRRGFLDGPAGFDYARAKARYYAAISSARKSLARTA